MNKISRAASLLGTIGGQSGTGESKTRPINHYQKMLQKRWGNKTPEERFWSHVDKRGEDECWPWTGALSDKGYGVFNYQNKVTQKAHRMAVWFTSGPFDVSKDVCHHCDNPPCCNPKHLFIGTASDNLSDCVRKGRFNKPKGEDHPKAKLTAIQVLEIRAQRSAGRAIRLIAQQFNVSIEAVNAIVYRRNWKHI